MPQNTGIHIGDAAAVAGGIHMQDSHNVQNVDSRVITNNSTVINNVTKSDSDRLQEIKTQFTLKVRELLSDNVLDSGELAELDELRTSIGLDRATADSIIDKVRNSMSRGVQKSVLAGPAAVMVKIMTRAFLDNDIEKVKSNIPKLAAIAGKVSADEVQHKYYVALAAVNPEKLVEMYESDKSDNYWRTYWVYVAYRKLGRQEEAENALLELSNYSQYPEENDTLMATVSSMNDWDDETAREMLDTVTGEYSPELELFARAIYLRLVPDMAKEMGADDKNCAFYIENILSFDSESSKVKSTGEKEAELNAVVDLGLSVKWATCNLGATRPEETGRYFAFGDVKGQTWNGSKWSAGGFDEDSEFSDCEAKSDAANNLKPEYDAAHVLLGGNWRMPTKDDRYELVRNCDFQFVENYKGSGIAGAILTSRKPGYTDKSIFFPATGLAAADGDDEPEDYGLTALCWTCSHEPENSYDPCYSISLDESDDPAPDPDYFHKEIPASGMTIRPVLLTDAQVLKRKEIADEAAAKKAAKEAAEKKAREEAEARMKDETERKQREAEQKKAQERQRQVSHESELKAHEDSLRRMLEMMQALKSSK